MKKIIILLSLVTLTSCSILLSDDSPELINERSCKLSCLETNKIYVDFDEDFGCMCQEK